MKDKARAISPAALSALAAGDMSNFKVASTPGGIEAQEAQGQRDLVASSRLPKDGLTPDFLKETGIVVESEVDDLFTNVTLPKGWKLEATDHSMWSKLLDESGTVRAEIFYKAAFYDRRAFLRATLTEGRAPSAPQIERES